MAGLAIAILFMFMVAAPCLVAMNCRRFERWLALGVLEFRPKISLKAAALVGPPSQPKKRFRFGRMIDAVEPRTRASKKAS